MKKYLILLALLNICSAFAATKVICVTPEGGRTPAFAGDSQTIVYCRDKNDGETELWLATLKNKRNIPLGFLAFTPLGLPDSGNIICLGSGIFPDLFLVDVSCGKKKRLDVSEAPSGMPFLFGKSILIFPTGYDKVPKLLAYDLKNDKMISIPRTFPPNTLKVSPDGKYAAVKTSLNDTDNLEVLELSNGKTVYRTNSSSGNIKTGGSHSPDFSPDSRYMVYVAAGIQPLSDLHMVDLHNGEVRRLTHDQADNQSPSFSQDGKQLVFTAGKDGQYQVFLMTLPE